MSFSILTSSARIGLARTASSRSSIAAPILSSGARMYSSSDAFREKEVAAESKYVHDHDRELIEKLRKDLAKKTTEQAAAAAALEAAIDAAPKVSPIDVGYGSGSVSSSSPLGKKEAALEEKYFRDQDKEKLERLKKH